MDTYQFPLGLSEHGDMEHGTCLRHSKLTIRERYQRHSHHIVSPVDLMRHALSCHVSQYTLINRAGGVSNKALHQFKVIPSGRKLYFSLHKNVISLDFNNYCITQYCITQFIMKSKYRQIDRHRREGEWLKLAKQQLAKQFLQLQQHRHLHFPCTIFNRHFNPGRFLVRARYTFYPGIKATTLSYIFKGNSRAKSFCTEVCYHHSDARTHASTNHSMLTMLLHQHTVGVWPQTAHKWLDLSSPTHTHTHR